MYSAVGQKIHLFSIMRRFESNQCLHLFFFIFIVSYFHIYPLRMIGKQLKHLNKVPIKWDIIKHGTYMRYTTDCINSIGYALFAVIQEIFINRNGLEMIMNYIFK